MELRKLNHVGKNTLTISLPKSWTIKNNLDKGDQLDIEEQENRLIIKTINHEKKEGVIESKNINTFLLNKLILNAYMKNYNKIIINIENEKIYNNYTNAEVSIFNYISNIITSYLGMEIISHGDDKIILQNLFEEGGISNMPIIQKRVVSLYSEFLERLCGRLSSSKNFSNYNINKDVSNIRKFIYYNMRLIVNSEKSRFSKIKLYVLYDHLDNSLYGVEKLIKLLARKQRINKKISKLIKEIFNIFISFLNMEEDMEIFVLNKFIKNREDLLKRIFKEKLSLEENKIIREIEIFLNLHHDFILARLQ
ncbi:MAG: AbrB/MazE/SpoVT family DNA-binding domain-containing protein [Candidatus Pacearchaeota archaeon]|nr:AbrB/MazE/SpoVT family DNA-binding domain-containing protein [Candidatus Pacearchaeota archaeon]